MTTKTKVHTLLLKSVVLYRSARVFDSAGRLTWKNKDSKNTLAIVKGVRTTYTKTFMN